jgi:hypothetical protein
MEFLAFPVEVGPTGTTNSRIVHSNLVLKTLALGSQNEKKPFLKFRFVRDGGRPLHQPSIPRTVGGSVEGALRKVNARSKI